MTSYFLLVIELVTAASREFIGLQRFDDVMTNYFFNVCIFK